LTEGHDNRRISILGPATRLIADKIVKNAASTDSTVNLKFSQKELNARLAQ